MARFIIHAGYSKTGTTALQRYLAFNRRALRRLGILYPDFRHMGSWLQVESHNAVAASLVDRRPWPGLTRDAYFCQIGRQLQASPDIHTVILSGESFVGVPQPWLTDGVDAYRQAHAEKVSRLRGLLGQQQVQIVVYLRRQDQWLESAINQTIKFEGLLPKRIFRSVEEFANLLDPFLDYASILDIWAREFGEKNIDVGPYEKGQLRNGNVIDDFFARIEIERAADFREPNWDGAASNRSLSRDVLEAKRILNEIPKPKYEERFIAWALGEISREIEPAEGKEFGFLSPRERHALVVDHASRNEIVARRFLDRPSADLFREPWPDPDSAWEAYPGLSVERSVEILYRLNRRRHSLGGRWTLSRHRIAELLRRRAPGLHAGARAARRILVAVRGATS